MLVNPVLEIHACQVNVTALPSRLEFGATQLGLIPHLICQQRVGSNMYTISKVPEGIILTCKTCTHIESVSQFNLSLGSQRTQAARAMQSHHAEHDAGLPKFLPRTYEVMASAAVRRHTWTWDR